MVLFRHGSVDHIHFPSLKTLDLSCARMLVRAIAEEKSNLITFGFGFDISNISPEVLVELSKVRYGWYDSGGFSIYSEQYYKDQESHLI
jgi:hypothetical protein